MKQNNFSHRRLDCLLFLTSKHFKIIFPLSFADLSHEKNVYKAVIILHQNCWYVHCCHQGFPFSGVQATLMHRSDLTSLWYQSRILSTQSCSSGWPWDSSLPMPKLALPRVTRMALSSVSCSPKPLTGQQCSSSARRPCGGQHYAQSQRDGP